VSRRAVCKHARVLQRGGLIRAAPSGCERIYALAPGAAAAMRAAAMEVEEPSAFLDRALDAFGRHAEEGAVHLVSSFPGKRL
jgi:hypothetical protein